MRRSLRDDTGLAKSRGQAGMANTVSPDRGMFGWTRLDEPSGATTPPMKTESPACFPAVLTRRDFLSTSSQLAAVIAAAPYISRAESLGATAETVNVAIVGWGQQGNALTKACLKIPGVRFQAVCDLLPANRTHGTNLLRAYKQKVRSFENYAEMLATVPDIDAVIVATPDFKHAEHTNAALRAGKHVYCEKLMSNTVEGARSMVRTARETGKLLQIGHQRRSNACYRHAREKILHGAQLLGRITNISGEWHRAVAHDIALPERDTLPAETLARHGFANMHEFLNWRWYRKYAGGPISDLGAHQIDIYNWMLDVNPSAVMASGGIDYYREHEWYDNAVAVYEYRTKDGIVRATYDVLTTTSAGGGYHEYFMGDKGALKISENPRFTKVYREAHAPDWAEYAGQGIVILPDSGEGANPDLKPWDKPRRRLMPPKTYAAATATPGPVDVRESAPLSAWDIPLAVTAIHQPHLENFFDAIRKGTPLNCPGEAGFASAVTVLAVNEAIAAEKKLTFSPADFVA